MRNGIAASSVTTSPHHQPRSSSTSTARSPRRTSSRRCRGALAILTSTTRWRAALHAGTDHAAGVITREFAAGHARRSTRPSRGCSSECDVARGPPGARRLRARARLGRPRALERVRGDDPARARGRRSSKARDPRQHHRRAARRLARSVARRGGLRGLRRGVQARRACRRTAKSSTSATASPIAAPRRAADRVFATRGLARYFDEHGLPYEPFDDFHDVVACADAPKLNVVRRSARDQVRPRDPDGALARVRARAAVARVRGRRRGAELSEVDEYVATHVALIAAENGERERASCSPACVARGTAGSAISTSRPDFRRGGVRRRLVREAATALRAQGAEVIELDVQAVERRGARGLRALGTSARAS